MALGWRRLPVIVCAGLLVAACSPPTTSVVIDLRLAADGSVERSHATFEEGWSDPFGYGTPDSFLLPGEEPEAARQRALEELDQVREACLDDGTCIRLLPGATIVESSDGFDTVRTVWSVSPGQSWLDLSHGVDGVRAVAEVYDILVMPDQTVQVAAGDLGVLVRSADGQWSPSEADLRTLSKGLLRSIVLAGLLVVLLGAMLFSQLPGPHVGSATKTAAALAFPALLSISLTLLSGGGASWGVTILAVFAALLMPVVLGLLVVAINRERRFSGRRFFIAFVRWLLVAWLLFVVATAVVYFMWSRAVVGWPVFLVGVHVFAPIAAYHVARQVGGELGDRRDAQLQEIPLRSPVPIALAVAVLLVVGVPLLTIALAG